jgi:organic radical activating enzyme
MKKICVMPWLGIEINNNGNLSPCCVYKDNLKDPEGNVYNINTHTLEEYINSNELTNIRTQLLEGKSLPGCIKCYDEERVNIDSMRIRKNKEYKYTFKNNAAGDLLTVDLKLSNLCNQKCVICNSVASSMIAAENKEILPDQNKDYQYKLFNWYKIEDKWEQLKNNTTQTLHFDIYGGEPWLIKKQWEFIKHLIDTGQSKNISLNYATNGSIHEDYYFTEYFSKFKKVTLLYSADGIEDTFEYNRYPGKWEIFKENILKAKQYRDNGIIEWMAVAYTISAFSIYNVIDSLNFYKDHDIPVWFNMVNEDEFKPGLLPDAAKLEILNYIKTNWRFDFNLVDNIDLLFFESELTKKIDKKWQDLFVRKINARDAHRVNKLTNILPFQSIVDLLKESNNK